MALNVIGTTDRYLGTAPSGTMLGLQDAFVGCFSADLYDTNWIRQFAAPYGKTTGDRVAMDGGANLVLCHESDADVSWAPTVFLMAIRASGAPQKGH